MLESMRVTFLSSVFVATALTGAHAQQSLSIEQVKEGLYAIIGSGGNVGVRVTDEGVILIDDKYPPHLQGLFAVSGGGGALGGEHGYGDLSFRRQCRLDGDGRGALD